jgi:hypothetical protein
MILRRLLFPGIRRYSCRTCKRLWPNLSLQVTCAYSVCYWDHLKRQMFPCYSIFWQYLKTLATFCQGTLVRVVPAKWQSHHDRNSGFEGCKNSSEIFFHSKVLLAICCCRLLCNNLFLFWKCEITAFEICSSVDFCCVLEEWKKTSEKPKVKFWLSRHVSLEYLVKKNAFLRYLRL